MAAIGTEDNPIEVTIGDDMFLSGTFTGKNLPSDSLWVGATAALYVTRDETGLVAVNGVAITTFDTAAKTWAITVAAPAINGEYTARARVTLNNGKKLSFPNGRKKIKIRAVA